MVFLLGVLLALAGGVLTGVSRTLQKVIFAGLVLSTMRLNPDVQFGFTEDFHGTVWGFRFTLNDLLALTTVVSLLTTSLLRRGTFRWFPRGALALWLLICTSLLSMIHAEVPLASLFEINNLVLGYLTFLAAANFIRSEEDVKFAIAVLLCALFIPSVVAFKQHFQFLLGQRYIARAKGTTPHPNLLAMYLNALMPLALTFTLSTRRMVPRMLGTAACLFAVAALIFTLSRGGMVGMIFGSGLTMMLWIVLSDSRAKLVKVAFILMLMAPIGVKWAPLFLHRITSTEAQVSQRGREAMTEYALNQWQEHPITGIGINNYALLRDAANVHNSYVLFLVETGVLGAMAFVLVLSTFMLTSIRNIFRAPRGSVMRIFSIATTVGLAALYLQLYAEFAIRSENIHYLFHVLAGLVVGTRSVLLTRPVDESERQVAAVRRPRPSRVPAYVG